MPQQHESVRDLRVGWVRGDGCLPLAELLTAEPIPVGSDLATSCVADRLDMMILKARSSFDLVPTIVPRSFDPDQVERVVVAVADGPHSPVAADIATRIASALGVPGAMTTVYRSESELADAVERLERLGSAHPTLARSPLEARSVKALLEILEPEALLVVGASEGSWFHRQLIGPGPSLLGGAPGGSLVVRGAPQRCFQVMVTARGRALGPTMAPWDAMVVSSDPTIPVAEGGRLVGIARRRTVEESGPGSTLADCLEDAVAVSAIEPAANAYDLMDFLDGGPVPVVDGTDRLLGLIEARRLRSVDGGKA